MNVPSSSENSLRHSKRGSSNCALEPNSSASRCLERGPSTPATGISPGATPTCTTGSSGIATTYLESSLPVRADVLVIYGITGDLAKVMTFRSLYRLERRGLLDCPIVGVAVDDWTV